NPLNNSNLDPGSGTHREEAPWGPIVGTTPPNYTLQLGYADNVHGCISGCFPNPFNGTGGTTAATFFRAVGLGASPPLCAGNCCDAGALLITGKTIGPFVTVTQGGWGAPPRGQNPGAILAANFSKVFGAAGVTIGCAAGGFHLTFTSASAIQAFLPQGGPPG